MIINAAAPSLIDEAFAAVTTPSFSKTGLSDGIFSNFTFPGSSSLSTIISSFLLLIVTGIISSLNFYLFTFNHSLLLFL